MKAKRVFSNIVVLLIAGAAVFFVGWMQLAVKPGTCGIMTSKTGGLYEVPIETGLFQWKWERLLPTNVTLKAFPWSPTRQGQTFQVHFRRHRFTASSSTWMQIFPTAWTSRQAFP